MLGRKQEKKECCNQLENIAARVKSMDCIISYCKICGYVISER